VACVSCWMLGRKIEPTDNNAVRERRIWLSISILIFALGINRQLDLDTALTEFGRSIAHSEGWYDRRRVIQLAFIASVALACLAAATAIAVWAREAPFPTCLGVAGTALVIGYVLVRAISLDQIDRFIGEKIWRFRWNWIFEMGAIGLVILASVWRARRPAVPQNPTYATLNWLRK
jgi:hypothetical protein